MTYSRHQLEAALREAIDTSETTLVYLIVPDPRELGEGDPGIDCYLQIIRQTVKRAPSNPAGAFEEKHEIWLLEPKKNPAEAEDLLDDKLAEVIDFVEAINFVTWSTAERGVHKSERHGYKITLSLTTDRTPE